MIVTLRLCSVIVDIYTSTWALAGDVGYRSFGRAGCVTYVSGSTQIQTGDCPRHCTEVLPLSWEAQNKVNRLLYLAFSIIFVTVP